MIQKCILIFYLDHHFTYILFPFFTKYRLFCSVVKYHSRLSQLLQVDMIRKCRTTNQVQQFLCRAEFAPNASIENFRMTKFRQKYSESNSFPVFGLYFGLPKPCLDSATKLTSLFSNVYSHSNFRHYKYSALLVGDTVVCM